MQVNYEVKLELTGAKFKKIIDKAYDIADAPFGNATEVDRIKLLPTTSTGATVPSKKGN